jgi:hypothetical protein
MATAGSRRGRGLAFYGNWPSIHAIGMGEFGRARHRLDRSLIRTRSAIQALSGVHEHWPMGMPRGRSSSRLENVPAQRNDHPEPRVAVGLSILGCRSVRLHGDRSRLCTEDRGQAGRHAGLPLLDCHHRPRIRVSSTRGEPGLSASMACPMRALHRDADPRFLAPRFP